MYCGLPMGDAQTVTFALTRVPSVMVTSGGVVEEVLESMEAEAVIDEFGSLEDRLDRGRAGRRKEKSKHTCIPSDVSVFERFALMDAKKRRKGSKGKSP